MLKANESSPLAAGYYWTSCERNKIKILLRLECCYAIIMTDRLPCIHFHNIPIGTRLLWFLFIWWIVAIIPSWGSLLWAFYFILIILSNITPTLSPAFLLWLFSVLHYCWNYGIGRLNQVIIFDVLLPTVNDSLRTRWMTLQEMSTSKCSCLNVLKLNFANLFYNYDFWRILWLDIRIVRKFFVIFWSTMRRLKVNRQRQYLNII